MLIHLTVRRFVCTNPAWHESHVRRAGGQADRPLPAAERTARGLLSQVALELAGRSGMRPRRAGRRGAPQHAAAAADGSARDGDHVCAGGAGCPLIWRSNRFCCVSAGGDAADASAACSGGADAVLLEQAAEPEKVAVNGSELFLKLADRCLPHRAPGRLNQSGPPTGPSHRDRPRHSPGHLGLRQAGVLARHVEMRRQRQGMPFGARG